MSGGHPSGQLVQRILARCFTVLAPLLATAAAAFALGAALSSEATAATPCTNTWTGAGLDGEWNTGTNWSLAHAPASSEHACILVPGSAVHLTGNSFSSVAGLDIGVAGATPYPTLWVNGSGAGGGTTLTSTAGINNLGTIRVESSDGGYESSVTVSGSPLVNQGTLTENVGSGGPRNLSGDFSNAGSVNVNDFVAYSGGTMSNSSTITIPFGDELLMQPGTTFDQSGGAVSNAGQFGMGNATLKLSGGSIADAFLHNTSVQLSGSPSGVLEYDGTDPGFTLTGTIPSGLEVWVHGGLAIGGVTGGDYAHMYFQNGVTNAGQILLQATDGGYTTALSAPGLTNTGTLHSGAGTTGALGWDGSFTNQGLIQVDATLPFGAAGDTDVNNASIVLAAGQSFYALANLSFTQSAGQVSGNADGVGLSNGSFSFAGGSVLDVKTSNEQVTFPAGSTASGEVEMNGTGTATLAGDIPTNAVVWVHGGLATPGTGTDYASVTAAGLTNHGKILLQSSNGGYFSHLTTTGLINVGTLQTLPSTGTVALYGSFTNQGTFAISENLPFGTAGDTDSNSGVITVDPGKSFYAIVNLAFTQSGGSITGGAGTFGLSNGSFTFSGGAVGDLQTANEHVTFPAGGTAAGSVEMTGTASATLAGDIPSTASVWIHGGLPAPGTGPDYASVTSGALTNHGHLLLESTNGGYYSRLTTSGLTNIGTLQTGAATTGSLALYGPFNNQGTFQIDASLPFGTAGDADSNTGTITISLGADFYSTVNLAFTQTAGSIVSVVPVPPIPGGGGAAKPVNRSVTLPAGVFGLSNGSFTFAGGIVTDLLSENEHVVFPNGSTAIGTVEMTGTASAALSGDIPSGATVWIHGGLAAPGTGNDYATVTAGPFTNNGTLLLQSSNGGYGTVLDVTNPDTTAGTVNNKGVVHAGPGSTSTITLNANLQNAALLQVDSPMLLGGILLNYSGGTLSGGTYQLTSAFRFTSVVQVAVIATATTVVLDGPNSDLEDPAGNSLLGQLSSNDGSLTIKNGRNLSTPPFTTSGTVQIGPNPGPPTTTIFTSNGDFIEMAGSVVLEDAASLVNAAGGTVRINGGTLSGVGTVGPAVVNAATVKPGFSPGILTVSGSYTQTSAGTLHIDIQGSTPGTGYGQLNASGLATLDGTLALVTAGGFVPPPGQAFTILTGSSVSGVFATVTGRDINSNLFYNVHYNPANVMLTVDPRLLPGQTVAFSPTEGASFSGTVAQFVDNEDPAGPASEYSVTIDWGDGSTPTGGSVGQHQGGGFDVTGSHTYAEESATGYTVTASITDNDAAEGPPAAAVTASGKATVADAVVTPSPSSISATEGAQYSGPVATFTDADPNGTVADYTATVTCFDGTHPAATIVANPSGGFIVKSSCTFAEEGSPSIGVQVSDAGGSSDSTSSTATVADAALQSSGVTITVPAGTPYSGPTASFLDNDPNGTLADYSATIDWGDASPTTTGTITFNSSGGFTVSGTHTYATPGGYTPTTTINDVGGSQTVAHGAAVIGAGPPPVVPEAPMSALLVLLGAAGGGAVWMRRRHRATTG